MIHRCAHDRKAGSNVHRIVKSHGLHGNVPLVMVHADDSTELSVQSDRPVDAVVMAIVDSLEIDGQFVYEK